ARPVEQQGRPRVGLELAALAALKVGVEDKAAGVVRLQQHGAQRGAAVGGGGGQLHGGAIGFAGSQRLVKQRVEGVQGFGVKVGHKLGGSAVLLSSACAGRMRT